MTDITQKQSIKLLQSFHEAELNQLYNWTINPNREPARTAFTAGPIRNIAKEFEYQLKLAAKRE